MFANWDALAEKLYDPGDTIEHDDRYQTWRGIMTTGTDTLRAALRARQSALTLIARDVGVALHTLQGFSTGSVTLLPEVKQKIATYIFGDRTVFDADADLLRSVSPPAIPIATALPPIAQGKPIPLGYPNTPWPGPAARQAAAEVARLGATRMGVVTNVIKVSDSKLDWRYFDEATYRRCRVRRVSAIEFGMLRARYNVNPPSGCCYFTVVWRARKMLHKHYFLALCQLNTGMSDQEARSFYHAIRHLTEEDDCYPTNARLRFLNCVHQTKTMS